MPCAAPCSRLPCNKRCLKKLSCGHQCPGTCGELCAERYCHQCSDKLDSRVDFLEMKSYGEIDVDETPIVVLGCGHFFTAESLDGIMTMSEVYEIDGYGEFTGLKDVSGRLAPAIPCCPDCKCPVRQFVTQRYNRVINRAVIDEMSKRFLTTGRGELQELEQHIIELEQDLHKTREDIIREVGDYLDLIGKIAEAKSCEIIKSLKERHAQSLKLGSAIKTFLNNFADKHQPAQKLHEATVHAARKSAAANASIDELIADLTLVDAVPALARDRRVTMGGQMVQIKMEFVVLHDKFCIAQALISAPIPKMVKMPDGQPDQLSIRFFRRCKKFIDECNIEKLPKLSVEVSLFYASIARSFQSFSRSTKTELDKTETHLEMAMQLLENAHELCKLSFTNANILRTASEELNAIKAAMLEGSQGIMSHSGHWYNCENGHPVGSNRADTFDNC
jgi:hypothetical protein